MNIKLHLNQGRRRAAGLFHPHKASNGHWARARPLVAVPAPQADARLTAHWSRNAATGALECRWIADAPAEPCPRVKAARHTFKTRMHRRSRSAGLRPPSCLYAHG